LSPTVEAQATDRAHRIATAPGAGQTVEQALDRLLAGK
jgi:SNF2 family DNA or RNA helicase